MLPDLISILFLHTLPPIHHNFFEELPPLRLLSLPRRSLCLFFILSLNSATLRLCEVANDENAVLAVLHAVYALAPINKSGMENMNISF